MFAYWREYFKLLLVLVALCASLVAFGCDIDGGDETTDDGSGASADIADADPADVEVISNWVETLATGDVEGAAELFALPSRVENGSLVITIRDRQDAFLFNESLPCGAELLSASSEAGLTTATFELTERPGGDCGAGTGSSAATQFRIEDGKIAEWRRVPVPGEGDGLSDDSQVV